MPNQMTSFWRLFLQHRTCTAAAFYEKILRGRQAVLKQK